MFEIGIFEHGRRGVRARSERTNLSDAPSPPVPFCHRNGRGRAARPAAASEPISGDEHMTSFIYTNCIVGEVTGISDLGFGFDILNERVQPILSLAFKTRDDAAQARAEIAKAVAKAVEITRPALTAAGEP
jgi:hypothetical protein